MHSGDVQEAMCLPRKLPTQVNQTKIMLKEARADQVVVK